MMWNPEEEQEFSQTFLSISKEIDEFSFNYQNILRALNKELEAINTVLNKHAILSARLDEFQTLWNEKWAQTLDTESKRAVALTAWKHDAEGIQNILKTWDDPTRGVLHDLKFLADTIKRKVEFLLCFQTPSVNRVQDLQIVHRDFDYKHLSSQVSDLTRQWDELDLATKVDRILERLRGI